jgi:hypothetical protein
MAAPVLAAAHALGLNLSVRLHVTGVWRRWRVEYSTSGKGAQRVRLLFTTSHVIEFKMAIATQTCLALLLSCPL